MKIKPIKVTFEEFEAIKDPPHRRPEKQSWFFRKLLQIVSIPDLLATKFTYKKIGMERLGKKEPAFVLMNHSSFIDMEIVSYMFANRPFNIVATTDTYVGKSWLIHKIGCIPTKKFVHDVTLLRDMMHTVKKLNSTVIMFPEAGYTFDGTTTILPPDTLGKCVKLLGVPLISVTTHGAFTRDPLYNNLQRRPVKVSATQKYLLSAEEIKNMSCEEIDAIIRREFSFDGFRWQQENRVKVNAPTRADYLNRVLYKCPSCLTEGKMLGRGTTLKCQACGKTHELTEYGELRGVGAVADFKHVPDWYRWQREEVKREIELGKYSLDIPVKIHAIKGLAQLYDIGHGKLTHTNDGFTLTGCDGKLNYTQKPLASYTICSDFNWYEIGDTICIGDHNALYYCFPETAGDIVAKTRIAAEEMYKIAYKSLKEHRCHGKGCKKCESTTENK